MTQPGHARSEEARAPSRGPRHRLPRRSAGLSVRTGAKAITAVVSAATLILTGMGWIGYRHISAGITTSAALADEPSRSGPDQNILIMGVDSRRDQHGRPLPKDIYDALHAGDANSGEYDADALIVLHVPGGHGPVTAVSVPRDDYVDLAGCPASQCRGKVKHAYSLAYRRAMDEAGADTADSAATHDTGQEQKAREAGRVAEIRTVERLLQIPIHHFIEVSLVALLTSPESSNRSRCASTTTPQTRTTPAASSTKAFSNSAPRKRSRSCGNDAMPRRVVREGPPTWTAAAASRRGLHRLGYRRAAPQRRSVESEHAHQTGRCR